MHTSGLQAYMLTCLKGYTTTQLHDCTITKLHNCTLRRCTVPNTRCGLHGTCYTIFNTRINYAHKVWKRLTAIGNANYYKKSTSSSEGCICLCILTVRYKANQLCLHSKGKTYFHLEALEGAHWGLCVPGLIIRLDLLRVVSMQVSELAWLWISGVFWATLRNAEPFCTGPE